MPLNDAQKSVFEAILDSITEKLDVLVDKSKRSDSALNALGLLFHASLGYKIADVARLADILYSERKYLKIRKFFKELNELITTDDLSFKPIQLILDPRFIVNSTDIPLLMKEIKALFRSSLINWLEDKYLKGAFSKEAILELETKYSQNILKQKLEVEPELSSLSLLA